MKSTGTAVLAILFLAAGIIGGAIVNSIGFYPTLEKGYPYSAVLAAGFASVFALVVGLVLLLVWLIKQMY